MAAKLAVQTLFSALDRVTGPMATMGKGVDRFSRNANRAGASIGASWGKLRNVIRGVALAVTTGLVAKAVTDFADKGDEISRMANILGITAQGWQEMTYAAKLSDMTSEDLAGTFKKMNNSMGQLRTGSGALYKYLKATNPQLALQLKHTRNSEDAFGLLMDAIAKETDTAARAALTQAAFGKGGQPIIEMAAKYNELRREAQDSGGIISNEDIEAGQELDENLKRITVSGQGFINHVLGRAVKAIGPWLDKLNLWIKANRKIIGQKIEDTINWIVGAMKKAYDIWVKWKPVIIAVGIALFLMNRQMQIAAIISVVSKAITIASAMMEMFAAGASLATVAQWGLNAAMDANPIGAVILALAAMVLVVILVIHYWKQITDALRSAWNWFNKLFGNPWIRTALYMCAAPLAIIVGFIQTIVDLLQGKGWKSFLNMAGPLKAVTDALRITQAGGEWAEPGQGKTTGFGALREAERPVSPNLGVISSNATTTNQSILKVLFGNTPAGTSMKQEGASPGISVEMFNTLFGGAG